MITIINVIIPAYNAEKTIGRTLSSLMAQSIKKNKFFVTIVDDCSTDNTINVIEDFKKFLPINLIKLPENKGVGNARQIALENNQCDFITFVDADDMLMPFALNAFYREMISGNPQVLYTDFICQSDEHETLLNGKNSITWFHGKMYRKSFLDEYEIFVPKLRFNEDSGFSTMVQELAERKAYLPEITYFWSTNPESITHHLESNFKIESLSNFINSLHQAFSHIYLYKELQATPVFYLQINNFYIFHMRSLYKGDSNQDKVKEELQSFFNEFWIESKIRAKMVVDAFSQKSSDQEPFLPCQTPIEWLSEMTGINYTNEDFKE